MGPTPGPSVHTSRQYSAFVTADEQALTPVIHQRSSLCPRTPSPHHGIPVVTLLRPLQAETLGPLFSCGCPARSEEDWPGVPQDVPRLRASRQGSLLPMQLLPADAGPGPLARSAGRAARCPGAQRSGIEVWQGRAPAGFRKGPSCPFQILVLLLSLPFPGRGVRGLPFPGIFVLSS